MKILVTLPILVSALPQRGREIPETAIKAKGSYSLIPSTSTIDTSNIRCQVNKKQVQSHGELVCPTQKKGNYIAFAGDTCQVRCDKGYKVENYDTVTCQAVIDDTTGSIYGIWSEKEDPQCMLKSEVDLRDPTQVTCPLAGLQPDNGKIVCQTSSEADDLAIYEETCSIVCDSGYENDPESYTFLTCTAQEANKGKYKGVLSQTKKAICRTIPTPAPTTQPTTQNFLYTHTPAMMTYSKNQQQISAYFPNYITLKNGWSNLNLKAYFEDQVENLSKANLWQNHWQTLKAGQCVVCQNARNMKDCVEQNKTCNLRKGQVCMTEVRRDGKNMLITRGCEARSTCLSKYFMNIKYDGARSESLISATGLQPAQQCRHMSKELRLGRSQISPDVIRADKSCYSCSRFNLAVPYL